MGAPGIPIDGFQDGFEADAAAPGGNGAGSGFEIMDTVVQPNVDHFVMVDVVEVQAGQNFVCLEIRHAPELTGTVIIDRDEQDAKILRVTHEIPKIVYSKLDRDVQNGLSNLFEGFGAHWADFLVDHDTWVEKTDFTFSWAYRFDRDLETQQRMKSYAVSDTMTIVLWPFAGTKSINGKFRIE